MDKQDFSEFVERLRYHNRGEGKEDHITANPLFLVEEKRKIYGLNSDYSDQYCWVNESYDAEISDEELLKELEDEEIDHDVFSLEFDNEVTKGDRVLYKKIYYQEHWEYVNSHLTKEGAEAFIKRKSHDHSELRIYVSSQYWCWEFNGIISAILDGQIVFKE